MVGGRDRALTFALSPQSLQEEPTSTCSQLAELMMAARVTLSSQLPRDLPPDALLKNGSFLINLEGEWLTHTRTTGGRKGTADGGRRGDKMKLKAPPPDSVPTL